MRTLGRLAAALLLAGIAGTSGAAETVLVVSATVPKQARLSVSERPDAVEITADDLARGYVDVAESMFIAVRSNSPEGYLLELAAEGEFLQAIQVDGLGGRLQFGSSGGSAVMPATGRGAATNLLRLRFRFTLAQAAKVGTYPWPLQLAVMPL